uniref:Uncharacterized protein n=1 Tax=Pavo cristatus TaxID=9049 RepID=A0A8C9F5Y5_PAVCR
QVFLWLYFYSSCVCWLSFFALPFLRDMDRDYGHGGYGGPRSMDSYLNQSYGMESHGGGGGGGGGGGNR